ncbi:asparagine synthase (glutamine-hydrolyzing) [candidate division WS5 bacterium]|uniref:asparagine synthase (glutamine-hydrolyzing) n=1 Tax=candidate division WS5 bacterium TaxID=2093353 RepID=A0A419DE52_9BACT|nr:MAG: asparagine synthase (glutamine-hydrolyzing) [candidate division WS5 bacterium]
MCGILGVIDRKGVDEHSLRLMRDTMVHRGPDDAGIWISRNREIGLAHRRLSIIDLSEAGKQPMPSSDGTIQITYNGEIYNYLEVRRNLKEKGYIFTSRSDTEVIINAYKEWGLDCIQKFNGMFAFAIYDENAKVLFLARDRIGKKPLYYVHDHYTSRFTFASEIKALLKDNKVSRDIDFQALNYYFTFGYIPGELCIFKDVRKLLPAHAMIYHLDSGEKKIWCYWDVPVMTNKTASEDKLLEELDSLIEDAVRIRLISDVPLGAFLSGGIDSSIIIAMMSRASNKPVKTFSIGFEDDKYNELPYARIVADYFGTEHYELIVKPDVFSILPDLVRQFDEPFADSSMIPTYYVSKITRGHVTVALSGDGGDEIFGGYLVYRASLFDYYLRRFIPFWIRNGVARAAEYFPDSYSSNNIIKQLVRMGKDIDDVLIERYIHLFFKERQRQRILSDHVRMYLDNVFTAPELSRLYYLNRREGDIINRLTYADLKTYLPDDIMVKVDRMSMLVSLETRAPLLDYRIAEFSFRNIPGDLKVKRTTTKYLLRKLSERNLPRELNIKRKWGFSIPLAEWFRGPLSSQIMEILLGSDNKYCSQTYIKKLLDEHKNGTDHSTRLYTLLVFSLWKEDVIN